MLESFYQFLCASVPYFPEHMQFFNAVLSGKNAFCFLGFEIQCVLLILELFSNGTNLHLCIQKYLEGQSDIDLKEPNRGHWTSLELVLNDVTDVACTEKPVKHPILRYKGILDCVANYRLVFAVILHFV